jgi:hypothetical protein
VKGEEEREKWPEKWCGSPVSATDSVVGGKVKALMFHVEHGIRR